MTGVIAPNIMLRRGLQHYPGSVIRSQITGILSTICRLSIQKREHNVSDNEGAFPHDPSSRLLSDITIYSKYARYREDLLRREVWPEIVERNIAMHIAKFPDLRKDIEAVYELVHNKRILPSMRSLQFAGKAVSVNNARMFNCSFIPISSTAAFSEIVFLLLCGTGVGFSVQNHHVASLPNVKQPHSGTIANRPHIHVIEDSIEGWASAVRALMETYLPPDRQIRLPIHFDFSEIRPQGSSIATAGGRSPGPEPLRVALKAVENVLQDVQDNSRLSPLQVHDIVCHLSTCVASGGIRRSALICLFSPEDDAMMTAKTGSWWEKNYQRAMANNSVVLDRHAMTQSQFKYLWQHVRASGSGEPGIYITNSAEWGTNPCCEIALEPYQFCNLTEMNVSNIRSQEELNLLARGAAFIGTLQASYTDFHFLRPEWKQVTERGALLGVGMTGLTSTLTYMRDMLICSSHCFEVSFLFVSFVGWVKRFILFKSIIIIIDLVISSVLFFLLSSRI